jgi:TP901 family phage tail tape measure protein
MNEVDARLKLIATRSKITEAQVTSLRERAAQALVKADQLAKKNAATRADPRLGMLTEDVAAKERALQNAIDRFAAAQLRFTRAVSTGVDSEIQASTRNLENVEKRLSAAQKSLLNARDRLSTSGGRLASGIEKEAALRRQAITLMKRASLADEHGQAMEDVATKYAARLAQNAQEHRIRVANAVSATAEKAGIILGGGLVVATKVGADFNQMLVTTAHNTSLSAAGVDVMNKSVRSMGIESGADMEKLADGFRAVENRGFAVTDVIKILTPAMQAAVAKGSDLGATTTLLANVMKEFSIPVTRAKDAMAVLVETSRRSGTTMDELVHVFGTMSASSANLGVSLIETSAAYILMTRHGLNASQAATQFRNDINKIINPSKQVKDAVAQITKETGVDLVHAFSGAGLRANGLIKTMAMIRDAAAKYRGGTPVADLVTKLFPLQRGQLGASILTGTGFAETNTIIRELTASTQNGAVVTQLYNESLQQTNQQFARLKNAAIVAAASLSSVLAPGIMEATNALNGAVNGFNRLDGNIKGAIVRSAVFAAGTLILVGQLGKLVTGIAALNTAFAQMGLIGEGGGMLAFLGAIPGVGWAAIAVLAALGVAGFALAKVTDDLSKQEMREWDTLRQQQQQSVLTTAAQTANARQVSALVAEYNNLHNAHHRTAEQAARMQDVLNQISTLSPQLVTGFNAQGEALGLIADNATRAAQSLRDMSEAQTLAATHGQAMNIVEIAQQRSGLATQLEQQQYLLSHHQVVGPGGYGYHYDRPNNPFTREADPLERLSTLYSSNYMSPIFYPATPADTAKQAARIRELKSQMAALDRQTKQVNETMHETFVGAEFARHGRLGRTELMSLAMGAGFSRQSAPTAAAIAMAESSGENQRSANVRRGGRIISVRPNQVRPGEHVLSYDRGLWQINDRAHPDISDATAMNPSANAAAAFRLSHGGTDFRAWTTYTSGAYKKYMRPGDFDLASVGYGGGSGKGKVDDLGQKARKAKAQRESEAEKDARRESDRYQGLMEGFMQQSFLSKHQGKEGEALWETMAHGTIKLATGLHTVTGEFANYNSVLRQNLVAAAKAADAQAAHQKYVELQKKNAFDLFALQPNADGSEKTPMQFEFRRAKLGMYDEYGKDSNAAMQSNVELENAKQHQKNMESIKKFTEEANKPLDTMLDTYQQMLKDIKADAGAYRELGQVGAEALARLAMRNQQLADSTKLYRSEMEQAKETADKIMAESAGNKTDAFAKATELSAGKLNDLTPSQMIDVLLAAVRNDKAKQAADVKGAQASVGASLGEQVKQAHTDVLGALYGPDKQREIEFTQRAVEGYGDAWKVMSDKERAAANSSIKSAYDRIKSENQYEAQLHKTRDMMEDIKKEYDELTQKIHIQVGNVKVTDAEWKKLSKSQQDAIVKLARVASVKDEVTNMLNGLTDLFGRTLDNLREKGFKNFFADVVAGFDDMLFQLAKKWLMSQFLQLITNSLGPLLQGALGGTPPIAGVNVSGMLASGGPVEAGRSYIVGERGQEVFTPSQDGRVISNSQMGGNEIHLHLNGVTDAGSFIASRHQVMQALGRAVQATVRR